MSAHRHEHDEGLTLVEVIVTTILAAAVFLIIGGLMVSLFNAQRTVSAATISANEVQAVARGMTDAINNASHVQLTPPTGPALLAADDQMLVVRTAGSDPATRTWQCTAYYYSSADNELRTRSWAVGTAATAPTAAQLATWTLLLPEVRPTSGTGIMHVVSDGVSFMFEAGATDGRPVLIETAAKRPGYAAAAQTAADRCF